MAQFVDAGFFNPGVPLEHEDFDLEPRGCRTQPVPLSPARVDAARRASVYGFFSHRLFLEHAEYQKKK